MPSNVLPLHLMQIFQPIIWIFIEGDGIESRLPFKIFSILQKSTWEFSHGLNFSSTTSKNVLQFKIGKFGSQLIKTNIQMAA